MGFAQLIDDVGVGLLLLQKVVVVVELGRHVLEGAGKVAAEWAPVAKEASKWVWVRRVVRVESVQWFVPPGLNSCRQPS